MNTLLCDGPESIHHHLSLALARNPHLARRNVACEMRDGRVVLRGVVNSFFQKQMAQESIRLLAGESEIENLLEVTWA